MSFRRISTAADDPGRIELKGINRRAVGRANCSREYADHGTPERWRHSGRALEPTDRAGVLAARAIEECLLDILALKRWITVTQREAALRLKMDFQCAGLAARLTGGYNPLRAQFSPLGPWDERSDAEEASYQRWRNAVRSIGAAYSDIVVTVVCHDCAPPPSRALFLRAGLERLVKWYGIPVEPLTCEN